MCNTIKRLWYKDILTSVINFCCYYHRPYLHKEVPEGHKCRPVLGFGRPALQHDIINVLRTVLWFDKPLSLLIDLMENLCKRTQMSHQLYLQKEVFKVRYVCIPDYHWVQPMVPARGWTFPTMLLQTSRYHWHGRRYVSSGSLEHTCKAQSMSTWAGGMDKKYMVV